MALFNVRVYGLLIDEQDRLLVSDEFIRGAYITKLPGGGLEIGEGTRDGLAREFMEEANLKITVGEHFYTTDFFQISAFNNVDQIISIYYLVHAGNTKDIEAKTTAFDLNSKPMPVITPSTRLPSLSVRISCLLRSFCSAVSRFLSSLRRNSMS